MDSVSVLQPHILGRRLSRCSTASTPPSQNASYWKWHQAGLQGCPPASKAEHAQVEKRGPSRFFNSKHHKMHLKNICFYASALTFSTLFDFWVNKPVRLSVKPLLPLPSGGPDEELHVPELQGQLLRNPHHRRKHGHGGHLWDGPGVAQGTVSSSLKSWSLKSFC